MSEATATGLETAERRQSSLGGSELIRSPEQVALELPIAGPMSRVLAFSVDYGIILVLEIVIFTTLMMAAISMAELDQLESISRWLEETQADLESGRVDVNLMSGWLFVMLAAWVVIDFVLQSGYFVVCELLTQGRSPGKAAFGLRVVRDGGLPIGPRESLLRNLMRMVDMLPSQYLVGLVSMTVSRQVRRLGDFAAGTLVVREERAEPARPIEIDAPRDGPDGPAFRFDREQLAAVGPVELRLVRQTLRRIQELPTWKRKEVLARSAEALCARIAWQEPLPPEQHRDFLMALLRDAEGRPGGGSRG